jgi:arylsulfatase A-like enzyme
MRRSVVNYVASDKSASRPWLLAALVLAFAAICACGPAGTGHESPPNVILLVVDTLRQEHLGAYGYPRDTTPNLDRLIAEGVRFENAISPSSWSAPAHISMVTGERPYNHRVFGWGDSIRPEVTPLAASMKAEGYRTGLFASHKALAELIGRIKEGYDRAFVLDKSQDVRVIQEAREWILKQPSKYFAHLILMTPHGPYAHYPEEFNTRYFRDTPPGGEEVFPFTDRPWIGRDAIPKSIRLQSRNDVGYYVNRYDRCLRFLDQLIGELVDALEEEGKLDNTLLIVTSDHGESFGDHDYFAHEYQLYDTLVRVPMFVRYPERVPPGQVWREQAQLVDIVPTILGFVGSEVDDRMDGEDLSSFLVKETRPQSRRAAVGSYRFRKEMRFFVRTDRYKLIYDAITNTEELYDLQSDPREVRDLLKAGPEDFPAAEFEKIRKLMDELVSQHRALDLPTTPAALSPELIKELRSLGYLGEGETEIDR